MKFCVQRGWGRVPGQAGGEEKHRGILRAAGRCVLTPSVLAPFYPEIKGDSEETVQFRSGFPHFCSKAVKSSIVRITHLKYILSCRFIQRNNFIMLFF